MFSDQDDYWYRDKIKVTLEKMKSVQENNCQLPILVHTDLEIVDSDLNTISFSIGKYQGFKFEQESINRLLVGNTVTGCTVMINKILLHMTKGLNDTSKIIMHDWWLALLASEYGKIGFIDESTIKYRQHTDNTIGAVRYDKRYIIDRVLHSSEVRKDLAKTRIQARYMADIFNIDKNDIVYKYAHIFSVKKMKRVYFYVKNDNKCSIFLCASVEEGFGLTGAESLATGCALVSTKYKGVYEYARDKYNALLVPVKDSNKLAESIIYLFINDDERIKLATNGITSMKERSWSKTLKIFECILDEKI